jgi:nuclear export mediator factor NEMF
MIRGKKNFLPPVQLIMALGFLYKLHPDSVERRRRKQGLLASIGDAVDALDEEIAATAAAPAPGVAATTPTAAADPEVDSVVASLTESADNSTGASMEPAHSANERGSIAESRAPAGDTSEALEEKQPGSATRESAATTAAASTPEGVNEEQTEEQEQSEVEPEQPEQQGEEDDEVTTAEGGLCRSLFDWGAASKYDLDLVTQEDMLEGMLGDEEVHATAATKKHTKGDRKKLSAYERRMLKRGLDPNAPRSPTAQRGAQQQQSATGHSPKSKKKGPVVVAPKRRQKAKKKKMLAKYKDQDEEERCLKMKALASAGKQAHTNEEDSSTSKQANAEAEGGNKDDLRRAVQPGERAARRREKREQEHIEARERELAATVDEAYQVGSSELSALTATPEPEDVLLYAVPVCGPYASLQDYRHHVKLVPGKMKRGQGRRIYTLGGCSYECVCVFFVSCVLFEVLASISGGCVG